MKKFIMGLIIGTMLVGAASYVSAEDKTQTFVSKIYQNTFGDVFKIFDKNSNIQAKLGTSDGKGDNINGTLILYNNNESNPRVAASVRKETNSGFIVLYDKNNQHRLYLSGEQKDGGTGLFLYDNKGKCLTTIGQYDGYINNQKIVTQNMLLDEIKNLQKQIDELKK